MYSCFCVLLSSGQGLFCDTQLNDEQLPIVTQTSALCGDKPSSTHRYVSYNEDAGFKCFWDVIARWVKPREVDREVDAGEDLPRYPPYRIYAAFGYIRIDTYHA